MFEGRATKILLKGVYLRASKEESHSVTMGIFSVFSLNLSLTCIGWAGDAAHLQVTDTGICQISQHVFQSDVENCILKKWQKTQRLMNHLLSVTTVVKIWMTQTIVWISKEAVKRGYNGSQFCNLRRSVRCKDVEVEIRLLKASSVRRQPLVDDGFLRVPKHCGKQQEAISIHSAAGMWRTSKLDCTFSTHKWQEGTCPRNRQSPLYNRSNVELTY